MIRIAVCSIIILSLLTFVQGCSKEEVLPESQGEIPLSPAHEYFVKVAFGESYSPKYRNIRKWTSDIKIFLPETQYLQLNAELENIISELNELIKDIKVEKVSNLHDSNFVVYFGDGNKYVHEYEPDATPFIVQNVSLFWFYSTEWTIYKGSVYIDPNRIEDTDCQKHRLREEITQSLGLMLDSYDYPNSIFYKAYSCVTEYSDFDKRLIQLMYDPNIYPGMSQQDVIEYLRSLQIIL